MKIVGIILLIIGVVGLVVFGIQAINDSESFSVLGAEVAVSKANWTPLIVSAIVTVIGIVLTVSRKQK
ncbi:transglycosylase [Marinilabilia sp.]|uniref:transglycosylase n=1 Tax=Marinilabilia sp. TaxID=2021252 RepID=UPI0025BD63BC|nr:transglycosylase [Marinilabilia sp.]